MKSARTMLRRGFSLIELVIVIVIIGIIAAIAIPRMSRGAEGANDSALKANLAVLRNAIDLYQTEHEGKYPTGTTSTVLIDQLTKYSSLAHATNATQSSTYIYGPYLRDIPVLPVGANKGDATFNVTGTVGGAQGWCYDPATGKLKANLAAGDADKAGKDYNTY